MFFPKARFFLFKTQNKIQIISFLGNIKTQYFFSNLCKKKIIFHLATEFEKNNNQQSSTLTLSKLI
jgi:hypothetical protein